MLTQIFVRPVRVTETDGVPYVSVVYSLASKPISSLVEVKNAAELKAEILKLVDEHKPEYMFNVWATVKEGRKFRGFDALLTSFPNVLETKTIASLEVFK